MSSSILRKTAYGVVTCGLVAALSGVPLVSVAWGNEFGGMGGDPGQQQGMEGDPGQDQGDPAQGEAPDEGRQQDAASGEASEEAAALADDDMFTTRDLAGTYDEESAVYLTLSDNTATLTAGDGSGLTIDGSVITINAEGVYVLSGVLDNGHIVVDVDSSEKVQLVLDDAAIWSNSGTALFVRSADKVFVTLADGTSNTLASTGSYGVDDVTGSTVDATVFSKDDITFNGSGSLRVESEGHGIVSKDDLVIAGGTYSINAGGHGISGQDSIRIAGGDITVSAGKNGLDADNAEDSEKGFIYIAGGTIDLSSGNDAIHGSGTVSIIDGTIRISALDDGIHSDTDLEISGGTVDISRSYEGLEGVTVTVSGGDISIVSEDDGINAASGSGGGMGMGGMFGGMGGSSSCLITISGGRLTISAGGDGVDSNGNIVVSGGESYISGSTSNMDSALDYQSSGTITGGVFVAVGRSGMAQNFGSSSTQPTMLVTLSDTTSGDITLTDPNGNVLIAYSPTSSVYNAIVISCPDLTVGQTYTLQAGDITTTVEMTGTVTSGGNGGVGWGMMGGGNFGRGR